MDSLAISSRIAEAAMVGLIKTNNMSVLIVPHPTDDGWQGQFSLKCKGIPDSAEGKQFLLALLINTLDSIDSCDG